ncbi:hypothetical protein CDAR_594511 [Caerostris darwini]|uniref:Uncharacterized protein n=1 Tax=Caerostris darwini TaxID=1538125 RepID=A0AAV4MQ37_9ARAC|nr:hypothetical protein CDAR_594511 [Caerostris darwini]
MLPTSPTDINDEFLHVNYIAILEILSGLNRVKYLIWEKTALFHKKDEEEVLRLKAEADKLLKQVHHKCNQFGIKILKIPYFDELEAASARTVHNKLKSEKELTEKNNKTPLPPPSPKKQLKRPEKDKGFLSPPRHLTKKPPSL